MIIYISIIISLIVLLKASYTDIKERIVTNKLNFGATILALILFGAYSIYSSNIWPIFYSFFGMCLGFFFAWILWKIGVFAGGDVKLFMALGALNPFTPALIKTGIFVNSSLPFFPLTLFIYSLIAILPYSLVVVFSRLAKNKKFRKKLAKDMKKRVVEGVHASIIIASVHCIFSSYLNNYFVEAIILILILFFWNKFKTKKIIFTGILLLIALVFNWQLFLQIFVGVVITIVLVYGLAKLMFSLRPLLSKEIEVKDLEEGMIPAQTLVKEGKKVVEFKMGFLEMIEKIKKGQFNKLFPKNEIVSANKARGLIEEEIKELKKLEKKKLIGKKIKIKDSLPFVPTMLIGYGISLFAGDALLIIILGI